MEGKLKLKESLNNTNETIGIQNNDSSEIVCTICDSKEYYQVFYNCTAQIKCLSCHSTISQVTY